MSKASQDSLNPGPVLMQIMVRDSSTVVENFMEFDLASQRNAGKSSAPYVNSRTVLEGTNKEQFISAATFKWPLNAGVDKNPTITILPKNKLSGPTWKRSTGRKKSTLYKVPVFHITSAKRNIAENGVDKEVGAKGGKRSKGDIVKDNSLETIIMAEAEIQPHRV